MADTKGWSRVARACAVTLMSALACGVSRAGEELVVDGSTTVGPIVKAFAEFYMKNDPEVNITVSESGSGNGAKSLINGTCHIAAMSRFMKSSEYAAAVGAGVTPVAHIVALDALRRHRALLRDDHASGQGAAERP